MNKETFDRSETAKRLLAAIALAGRALAPPEITERVTGRDGEPLNWNYAKLLLDAALVRGLVSRSGFHKRARYGIVARPYGEWCSRTENRTENRTEKAPPSLPSLRLKRSEAAAAAVVSPFPEDLRTENRVLELLRELVALVGAGNGSTERRAHPEVRSPAPLPPLTDDLALLRDEIVRREGKGKPGFPEVVQRRLATDPEYVRMKQRWIASASEKEKPRTIGAQPLSAFEQAGARARRLAQVQAAKERLGQERVRELFLAQLERARREKPRASRELLEYQAGLYLEELLLEERERVAS